MVLHFPVAIQDSIAPKTDIRMTIGKIVQHVIDIIIFHDLLVGFTRKQNANLSTNLETMNFWNKNATKYASGNANQASCNTSKDSPT